MFFSKRHGKNNIQHPTLRFPTSMQQTKFRMLRWCLSIRHYWGSVGFSTDMFLWSFICAVPEMSRIYPSSIHILQHVAKNAKKWIITCLDALEIWTNAILFSWTSKAQSFWQLQRAARRMVDDTGSPSWTAWFGRTNPKELGWNQICFTGSGLASEVFEVYRYTCHQHTNVCRFSNVKKTQDSLLGLQNAWLEVTQCLRLSFYVTRSNVLQRRWRDDCFLSEGFKRSVWEFFYGHFDGRPIEYRWIL